MESRIETMNDFIYVPSMNLEIARERTHYNKTWFQAHEALENESLKMLTPSEFVNFLNYLRENPSEENNEIFNDITQVRSPWRAEWLDAYFEQREDGLYVLTGNRKNAEKLEGGLMEDRTPGISLDGWLKNPSSQGLPKSDIAKGSLYYWHPKDGGVARFYADSYRASLDCDRFPFDGVPFLGVRAAKKRE